MPQRGFLRVAIASITGFASLGALAQPGGPRKIAPGDTHSYHFEVAAGEYLDVVVEQRGADVRLELFDPDATLLLEENVRLGPDGTETLWWIAERSGSYRLDVVSEAPAEGAYELTEALRAATDRDRTRAAARVSYNEGSALHGKQTADTLERALDMYAQALDLYREVGDRRGEAETLGDIGWSYNLLEEKQKALDALLQALPVFQELGDLAGEAVVLNNIGLVYDKAGDKREALDHLLRALPLRRHAHDRAGEARTLNNIASAYDDVGEKQMALEYYGQALELRRAAGDRQGEARTLNNMAVLYETMGDCQTSLDLHTEALALRREGGDRRGTAVSLQNLGWVQSALGEHEKALGSMDEALRTFEQLADRRATGVALNNIGAVHDRLGDRRRALEYFERALALRRAIGDRAGEAKTLSNIGWAHSGLGERERGVGLLLEALSIFQAVGDLRQQAQTLRALAEVEGARGNLVRALNHLESALELAERLRGKVTADELRASYSASYQAHHELHVDLLMRLHGRSPSEGFAALALEASERGRARALLDLLTEARADIREGVDPSLREREQSLRRLLGAKADAQTRLLLGPHSAEQAEEAARGLRAVLLQLHELEGRIRSTSPRYAALTQPRPLNLKEIQAAVVDEDTLLLEYALGKERSYLWVVAPDSIHAFELPPRAEIEAAVRDLHGLLTARNRADPGESAEQRRVRVAAADSELPNAATTLSRMLLGPAAALLQRPRLLIVAHDALHFVPFAALPAPAIATTADRRPPASQEYRPLVVDHELAWAPSASIVALLRQEAASREPAPRSIAVLADPVFSADDERVAPTVAEAAARPPEAPAARGKRDATSDLLRAASDLTASGGRGAFTRLFATRWEAQRIAALTPSGQSRLSLDFAASRATAVSPALSESRIVHFATHAVVNTVHPELSGIVLSLVDERGRPQDGFLRAHEVLNLKLRADLVVLSGCRTGLGKEVKGEGLLGLTRAFMYAGARRVVASQWDLSDTVTAELMVRFYRGMFGPARLPAGAALRAAQIDMWRQSRWRSPYYWAAFLVQGDYR